MKKSISLLMVVMIVVFSGCKSKKAAEPDVRKQQAQPQVETRAEDVPAAPPVAETAKPAKVLADELIVKCQACGGSLKMKEDKTAWVCQKCGKEMDIKTYKDLKMQKTLEVIKKMKEIKEGNQP